MPTLDFPIVYTAKDGLSTIANATLSNFQKESMGGDADPQFNLSFFEGNVKVLFAQLPANWVGEWHENPKPQWILPISGGWWVETQDGKRIEMREGEVSFGADQNTKKDKNGNKGHRSGSLDGKPCDMMIVQLLDEEWVGATPDSFE